VLKFDHHCPWIGQCVGARNHKFFVNFLQWSSLFCIWTFATLVALIPQESKNDGTNIDPQHIVVIALAGLFFVFTVTLLLDHIRLICLNQTTVESLGFRDMREQESAALGRAFSWYQCGAKRRKKREWNEEWGVMDTEGNLWWLGSSRTNWESVMGKPVLWWILPIGRSASDGLEYPTNPRFDAEGRWRRRKEWPEDLQ
jgi:palmitoyltransferase